MIKEIYKAEIPDFVAQGALLIDVCEDDEARRGACTVPGSTSLPLSRLAELPAQMSDERPLVFLCRSGLLSYCAAEIASRWTDQPVYYLHGGLLELTSA